MMVGINIATSSPLTPLVKIETISLSPFHSSNPIIKSQHKCHNTAIANNYSRRRKLNCSGPTNFTTTELESKLEVESASNVVRKFYGGINGRDIVSVEPLIADNCVYEDLIFPHPFVGRKAILEFFEKFNDSISKDLQFVIDYIATEDSTAVGVTWHLEWKGKPFPFSRGCSFYQLEVVNGQSKIIYGRDIVEPAIKPGEAALVIIQGVTWLLQQFPKLAERL